MLRGKRKSEASARWRHRSTCALLGLAILLGCAGNALRTHKDGAADGVTGGTGGAINPTGGVPTSGAGGQSGGTGAFGGATRTGSTSSVAVDAAAAGTDASFDSAGESMPSCGETDLWNAIGRGAQIGAGNCQVSVPDYEPRVGIIRAVGYVVFDGDGRVVDNTALIGAGKQAWLDGLSPLRFPCRAGQTVQYMCIEMPI